MFLQIVVFYVLTWFFLMLLGGVQQATGILPSAIGLAQWGPGIAALLMLVIFRKDKFKITFFSKGTPIQRYLLALLPLGVGLVVFLISTLIPMKLTASEIFNKLPLVLVWIPLGSLGEELGWRGYLHKKLDTKMRGLISSVLVGILWMPIHVQFLSQGPLYLFFFTLTTISWSIVLYALVKDSGFSVLLATIFHMSIQIINLLILDRINDISFMMINALVWVIVAAIFVLLNRKLYFGSKVQG